MPSKLFLRVRPGSWQTANRCWFSNAKIASLNGGSVGTSSLHLKSMGYNGHFVASGRFLPVSLFDEAVHQRHDGEWFWKRKDYCNNFIFTASKST